MVADKSGSAALAGKKAYLDHTIKLLDPKDRMLCPLEKGMLRSVTCGAVWSQVRLQDAGYDVSAACPLCGLAPDTIHHRVWMCPCSEEARQELASRKLISEAVAAGEGDIMFHAIALMATTAMGNSGYHCVKFERRGQRHHAKYITLMHPSYLSSQKASNKELKAGQFALHCITSRVRIHLLQQRR